MKIFSLNNLFILLLFVLLWLGFAGFHDWLLMMMGVLSAFVCTIIAYKSKWQLKLRFRDVLQLISYLFWLLREIILANIAVVGLIFAREEPKPVVVTALSDALNSWGKIIYANSITLTPGTVSAEIAGDKIVVYALDKATANDLSDGKMYERIKQINCLRDKEK